MCEATAASARRCILGSFDLTATAPAARLVLAGQAVPSNPILTFMHHLSCACVCSGHACDMQQRREREQQDAEVVADMEEEEDF